MSTTSLEDRELQEQLREASALGDLDEVRTLVESGVNVNSQNEINGWTCLHWACKRNHKAVVSYLLNSGADKEILTAKDELPAQLTNKPDIKRLLGVEVEEVPEIKELELPFKPNYLTNPPFMYSKMDNKAELILNSLTNQNGSAGDSVEDSPSDPASLSPTYQSPQSQLLLQGVPAAGDSTERAPFVPAFIPVAEQNGVSSGQIPHAATNGAVPMDISVEPRSYPVTHNGGPVCSPPLPSPSTSSNTSSSSSQALVATANTNPPMTRQQSIPPQLSCGQSGSDALAQPAFMPFTFFNHTFPVNVQELVLKVRIQNPNARENDFIEVELDRQELTYRSLLRVCCRELDVSAEHVEKIRKLPNTMLRKDKDVARLQDFQELEVVLEKAEGLSMFSGAGGLTDRPCYNMKASRLTY